MSLNYFIRILGFIWIGIVPTVVCAQLSMTIPFESIGLGKKKDHVIKGSIDVEIYQTKRTGKQIPKGLVITQDDQISIVLSNFRWDKYGRKEIKESVMDLQGSRFDRENEDFRLEKMTLRDPNKDNTTTLPINQSVFLDHQRAKKAPGTIQMEIVPNILSNCQLKATLALRLRVINIADVQKSREESAEIATLTKKSSIAIRIPVWILPATDDTQENEMWQAAQDETTDIFAQTELAWQYLNKYDDCGRFSAQAAQLVRANEDNVCAVLDKLGASKYLQAIKDKKWGWQGSCSDKANSILGRMKEEEVFNNAMNSKGLSVLCDYLELNGKDAALTQNVSSVSDELNTRIANKWQSLFQRLQPRGETDRRECRQFLSYLNTCQSTILTTYINDSNKEKKGTASVCARAPSPCEILWNEISQLRNNESDTEVLNGKYREYLDKCTGNASRYEEILSLVKPKLSQRNQDVDMFGGKMYHFDLNYYKPSLSLTSAIHHKEGGQIPLNTDEHIQLLRQTADAIAPEKIRIDFSVEKEIKLFFPPDLKGEFSFEFQDAFGKTIPLSINTSLNPLEANLIPSEEDDKSLRFYITGGDSLDDHDSIAYTLIFQQIGGPAAIPFPVSLKNLTPDSESQYILNKEEYLSGLPDGQYQVTVRDHRNDEAHQVELQERITLSQGSSVSPVFLKSGLLITLLLMVTWLTYANIQSAKSAKKK